MGLITFLITVHSDAVVRDGWLAIAEQILNEEVDRQG